MEFPLVDRVVAITGALGTLGTALAERAAACGAKLVLIDRAESLHISSRYVLVLPNMNLAYFEDCQEAARRIDEHFGQLDALVNIAGSYAWETIDQGDPETWDRLYNDNLRTTLCTSKAMLPMLIQSGAGRIVNIGSSSADKGQMGMGAYTASKSGVQRLTESLAAELHEQGVTVNAVLPSKIENSQYRISRSGDSSSEWVTADQISSVILFLLSDDAAAITGAAIPVVGQP